MDVRGRDQLPAGLAAFRKQHPGAGVVLVVSTLDPRLMLEGMRAGVNECVPEPVAAKTLEDAVRRVLTNSAPQPTGQVFRDLPGLVQVAQEVGQRRTQRAGGFRGVASTLTPNPKPGQISGQHLVESFPADLVKVSQQLVRGALLRRDAGFGVAPPPTRREVFVPGRTETRRAALDRRRCSLAHPRQTPIQAFH